LSCFADSPPLISQYEKKGSTFPNPSLDAGIFSNLFFLWITKLIWTGYRRTLEAKDIFDLRPEHESTVVYPKFEAALNGYGLEVTSI
jgi:hypothetical protein